MSSPFQPPRPLPSAVTGGSCHGPSLRCAGPRPRSRHLLRLPLLPPLPTRKEEPVMPRGRLVIQDRLASQGPHLLDTCTGPRALSGDTCFRTWASSGLPLARATMGPFRLHVPRTCRVSVTVPVLPSTPAAPPGSCRGPHFAGRKQARGGGGPGLVASGKPLSPPRGPLRPAPGRSPHPRRPASVIRAPAATSPWAPRRICSRAPL